MSSLRVPVPDAPVDIDTVVERLPVVRQSLLSTFDDCPLSSYFEMRYGQGWTTHPAAAGTIFHRVAAEAIREMRRQDSTSIDRGVALAILEETLEQRDIEPEERVRVPLRDLPMLRMAVRKFAADNTFSIRHVVDVENRLSATLSYVDDAGEIRERTLTGQLDVLIADPRDTEGAVVVDWKNSWGIPPDHSNANPNDEDSAKAGLSYHGYFQQRFYAWLILKNYPSIKRVTLREFYVRKTKVRAATLTRAKLEQVEKELADTVREFDRCYASGKPRRLEFPDVAPWNPSPGKHCTFCVARRYCPIRTEAREHIAIGSAEEASRAVAELQVVEAIRKSIREAMRPYVERYGPVGAKWSKGRLAFGLYTDAARKSVLRFFTPEGADRAPTRKAEDKSLEDALKRAAERQKTADEQ